VSDSSPRSPRSRRHPEPRNAVRHEQADWNNEELTRIRVALRRLTKVRVANSDDVEDLVQETLLTMIEKHPGDGLQKGLFIWSLGILRNKIGNYYKRVRREGRIRGFPVPEHGPSHCSGHHATPESPLLYGDLRILLRRLMEDYGPAEKAVMELFFEGLKPAEIGVRMQPQSYQTVISRLHRGRLRLARRLEKLGYRPERRR
jgi:RNA polymerase sigma factor (sigma-70 family)